MNQESKEITSGTWVMWVGRSVRTATALQAG